MRRTATVTLALLLAVGLAGCSDDGGSDAPDDTDTSAQDDRVDQATLPTWNVGDYWTWNTDAGTFTSTVTEETGSDYIIDVDSQDTAFFHAREPISHVGPQGKSSLDGSQDAGPVKWFDWPLEHMKSWQMELDGNTYQVEAHARGEGRFHMLGTQEDVVRVEYTYDPSNKWFDMIQYNDEEGESGFSMEVTDHGSNWTGEVVRYDLEVFADGSHLGQGNGVDTYGTPPDATDMWLDLELACSESGNLVFGIGPVENVHEAVIGGDGPGYSAQVDCPDDVQDSLLIAEAPFEGEWGFVFSSTANDGTMEFTAWLRTLETIAVG